MCGRDASASSRANLLEQFHVDDGNAAELKGPDYNVAPTKDTWPRLIDVRNSGPAEGCH
jgi:putative SOS response-associated peptidase YedK